MLVEKKIQVPHKPPSPRNKLDGRAQWNERDADLEHELVPLVGIWEGGLTLESTISLVAQERAHARSPPGTFSRVDNREPAGG